MASLQLPRHPGLFSTTRFRAIASHQASATTLDWIILLTAGVIAACASVFLDLGLKRIPGHAILRVVFPMALGLALVPRRGAGCAMGGSALLTGVFLHLAGFKGDGLGLGALTSLTATGPLLDLTLRRVNGGGWQVLAFALTGLVSNLMALAVKGGTKAIGWEAVGRRPLWEWLAQASITYVVCGLLAGLISGLVLFYSRDPDQTPDTETAP